MLLLAQYIYICSCVMCQTTLQCKRDTIIMMTRGLFVFVSIVTFFLFIFFMLLGNKIEETVRKTVMKTFEMDESTASQVMYVCVLKAREYKLFL